MICYRCGADAGKGERCPSCGADLHIFQKVVRISNSYYNDGLEKAGVRNLSGAIISLKKALRFNKYHTEARNLLGLVYYEMGEVVDALSEWVISKSYQPNENRASFYLDEIQQNQAHLKTVNQTIKKYNQALLYCKQDSRDLAIIQLKKVLSLNPNLVKGHQLLALLYIQEGKIELAKKTLRTAGKIDTDNTLTRRYLKEVNAGLKEKNANAKKTKQDQEDLISYQSGNETIIMPKRFKEYSLGATFLYILLGLIIGVAVTAFLIVPSVKKMAQDEANKQVLEANDMIATYTGQIANLEDQIADLKGDVSTAESESEAVLFRVSAYEKLLNAYVAFAGQDILTAGNALAEVDTSYLSESAMEIYNTVNEEVTASYLDELYHQGYDAYSSGDYETACESLSAVVEQNPDYDEGYASYYLAQSYRKNDNLEAAIPHYQFVLDNYPGTERARTAANYIE